MTTISLAPEREKFVQGQIEAGHFTSTDELFDEAIRMMQEREEFLILNRDEIRRKIDEGMESLRRGETIDGEEAFAQLERELSDVRPQDPKPLM